MVILRGHPVYPRSSAGVWRGADRSLHSLRVEEIQGNSRLARKETDYNSQESGRSAKGREEAGFQRGAIGRELYSSRDATAGERGGSRDGVSGRRSRLFIFRFAAAPATSTDPQSGAVAAQSPVSLRPLRAACHRSEEHTSELQSLRHL